MASIDMYRACYLCCMLHTHPAQAYSCGATERVRKTSSSASTRPLNDAELFDTQSDALNASCTGALTAQVLAACKTLSAPAAVSGPCAASTV